MALHADLLDQADLLAHTDRRRPRQANLRRAVSAAYYALFHFLIDQSACFLLSGARREALRQQLARSYDHGQMRRAARAFAPGPTTDGWRRALGTAPSPELAEIAQAFIDLQDARHEADYDPGRVFSREDVESIVQRAQIAVDTWATVPEAEADAFLVALLVKSRS